MLNEMQRKAITDFLEGKHIPAGLGTEHEACSIASINLALTGELTDTIPACMSPVIGKWIIGVQDAMTDEMRNSVEWRTLLPLAAGTGREHESQRSAILLDWMWDVVLPELQDLADRKGFGKAWKNMTTQKTMAAANAAADAAADAVADAYDAAVADAYAAADAAADAAAADAYAAAAAVTANAAAVAAAAVAAVADANAAAANARKKFWEIVNPIEVLKRLISVSEGQ